MKIHLATLLALLAVLFLALDAMAAPRGRPRQTTAQRPAPQPVQTESYTAAPPIDGPYVEGPYEEQYFEGACTTCNTADCCCDMGRWAAGFAFVLVQPHREDDLAFTSTINDGTQSNTTDTNFENDTELAPRVWLEYNRGAGLGARVTYWHFDHGSPERGDTPAANGFETLAAPTFGTVDLFTNTPGEVLATVSDIDLDVLDLEGTKWTQFQCWEFGTTGGLRFASLSQGYRASLASAAGDTLAGLEASHRFDGIGPTFAIEARRAFGMLSFFSMARGAILFGDGQSGFAAVEGLGGTTPPFITTSEFERNDVVSVGEIQIGIEWRKYCCNGNWFFCRTALEGQVWQGAGSATQEDGDLGFFGANIALGMTL